MLAPDLTPVHFWKSDEDSFKLKLDELDRLCFSEYGLSPEQSGPELDILSLSPIRNRAVLNLMQRLKKSRGGPHSAASQRRKLQSLRIAKTLDDIASIVETPTRLSICRFNNSSPTFEGDLPRTDKKSTKSYESEMKFLFEVLGAATPYMHSPPVAKDAFKDDSHLRLCAADDDDFLSMRQQQMTSSSHAVSKTPAMSSRKPAPKTSGMRRSLSAPPPQSPMRTPATSRKKMAIEIENTRDTGTSNKKLSRSRSQSPTPKTPLQSPRNTPRKRDVPSATKIPSSVRGIQSKTPWRAETPQPTVKASPPNREATLSRPALKASTPGYLRSTKNSERSRSPVSRQKCEILKSVSRPGTPNSKRIMSPHRSTTLKSSKAENPFASLDKENRCTTPNLSPNITLRSAQNECLKSDLAAPVITDIGNADFFNSVMESCDSILAQLDAAVSKGPRQLKVPSGI